MQIRLIISRRSTTNYSLILDNSTLLSKGGTLFLESLTPSPIKKTELQHLVPIDQRRFGTSLLHQYRLP